MAFYRLGKQQVAYVIVGYPKVWEPYTTLVADEDGSEMEMDTGEGEWADDETSGRVLVRMVGDDHKYTVDQGDLTPIAREDFCGECGQLGCGHDGLDRG